MVDVITNATEQPTVLPELTTHAHERIKNKINLEQYSTASKQTNQ